MSDDDPDEPGFDYRQSLTQEILAMRDTVQGWQQAGSPNGFPVDLAADRALSDAAQHLSAAAAALEPLSGLTNPPAAGTHVSVDAMGRTRVQAAASPADRTRLVQDARRVAETSTPGVRGMLVYQVVRAFGDAVKFRGVAVPDEYSELAKMGDVALQYRDHCWKYDPPGGPR
jgi:hypothetical protein